MGGLVAVVRGEAQGDGLPGVGAEVEVEAGPGQVLPRAALDAGAIVDEI